MTTQPGQSAFEPLPLRKRDILDIFDTALKLYRRYFSVLMVWSLLIQAAIHVADISKFLGPKFRVVNYLMPTIVMFFCVPLLIGAIACIVTAALRGEEVSIAQSWQFIKPRYRAARNEFISCWFLSYGAILLVAVASFALSAVIISVTAVSLNVLSAAQVGSTVGFILIVTATLGCIPALPFQSWAWMTPIIDCFEDENRSSAAKGRAWSLLCRDWWRVVVLMGLVVLALATIYVIIGGALTLLFGGQDFVQVVRGIGVSASHKRSNSIAATHLIGGVFCIPAYFLVTAVLYLDLRVRYEGFDLEWTEELSRPHGDNTTTDSDNSLTGAAPFSAVPQFSLEASTVSPIQANEGENPEFNAEGADGLPAHLQPGAGELFVELDEEVN